MARRTKQGRTSQPRPRRRSTSIAARQTARPLAEKDLSTLRLPAIPEPTAPEPTVRRATVRRPTAAEPTAAEPTAPEPTAAEPTAPEPPTQRVPATQAPRLTGETGRSAAVRPARATGDTGRERALAHSPEGFTGERLPALPADAQTRALIIPGSGRAKGLGYLPRRERPMLMRLAVVTLTVCIVFSGLFAVAPLDTSGADAARGATVFQALSNAVVWHASPGFFWYTAGHGDTLDSLARRFNVQVGGIYELNAMLSGQEVEIGKAYKIPTDPNYGIFYRPPGFVTIPNGSNSALGPTYYDPYHADLSLAGVPPYGALCGPIPRGSGSNLGNYVLSSFDLKAPNLGAYWVRGFTWYHHGVDLANPAGTPIHAAQSGEVIFAGWDTWGGGWSVKINHCFGLATYYLHMEQLLVHVHQMVHVGDVVGLEGSTGWSTGPHLHFAVEFYHSGVDPMPFYGAYFAQQAYNITHFIPDA